MRVAVCFKGFARHWRDAYPYWKSLFDRYEVDVFFHVWDTDERKDQREVIGFLEYGNINDGPLDTDSLIDLYKPKIIVTESYKDFHETFVEKARWLEEGRNEYMKIHPERTWMWYTRFVPMMSMFYKWLQVSKLKQKYEQDNNFIYDIVLHTRTDFAVSETFRLDPTDHIVTGPWPNTQHTQHWVDYNKGMNDFWAYGPSKKMDMMANIYERLDDVWEFCMKTEGYGFFEAHNAHSLPITNIKLQGLSGFIKTAEQHGKLIR